MPPITSLRARRSAGLPVRALNMPLRQLSILLLTSCAVVALGSSARAQVYNPTAQFDAGITRSANPNGVWSYGWTAGLSGAFTLYSNAIKNSSGESWNDPSNLNGGTPGLGISFVTINNGNLDVPAGVLWGSGGGPSGNDYTDLRFTAPQAGSYTITVTFTGRQQQDNADAHVLVKGASVFDGVISADGQALRFDGTYTLAAGDMVEFPLGPNGDANLHPANVEIAGTVVLNAYDPVQDFLPGWSGHLNPNGVWTYGWSNGEKGALTRYTDTRVIAPDGVNEDAWDDLSNNVGFAPLAWYSTGAISDGNVDCPANALVLHGGGSGNTAYSHLIFTAPAAGGYLLNLGFAGRQININSDAHILVNGVSVFDTVLSQDGQVAPFYMSASLHAGDTVDCAVGQNGSSTLHPGNTEVFGTISVAPVETVKSVSPASADAGNPSSLSIKVTGTNFVNGDLVDWTAGGTTTTLTTTVQSVSELTATVPSALIASPGKATITVARVDGTVSAKKTFTILQTTLKLAKTVLTRDATSGNYTAAIALKNVGFLAANSTSVTASSLNGLGTSSSLPAAVGNIGPGQTGSVSLTFPSTAGSPGQQVVLKVAGAFSGGKFSFSVKVALPN